MSKPASSNVYQGDFHGWNGYFLENEFVRLVAVPNIGGRIMAYDLDNYAYLYVERPLAGKLFSPEENQGDGSLGAWKNYGGAKTWPAPQGWDDDTQWHGPPDPVLDTGRYQVTEFGTVDDAAVVEMISPPDPRTGLQITRRMMLHGGSSRLTLDLSFTNRSERTTRWSIWDVTQLQAELIAADGSLQPNTGCVVTAPLNSASRFPQGFNVMFGDEGNPQWQIDAAIDCFVARYLFQIGKVGIDSPGSWIAFADEKGGNAFVERFTYDADAEYPDGGATVECWTTGKGTVGNLNFEESQIYHMETEVLSPLYTFEPGERRTFQIEWGACKLPGRVLDAQVGGCTFEALSVQGEGDQWRVQGIFGVFDDGEMRLVGKGRDGAAILSVELGKGCPLESLTVDLCIPWSSNLNILELQSVASADGTTRLVASTGVA